MQDSLSQNHSNLTLPSASAFKPRLQLITGKGGVGRTTVAIALAQAFAKQGQKVLLLEVRDADSELSQEQSTQRQDSMLGRSLAQGKNLMQPFALCEQALEISQNLWAAQLVASEGHRGFLRSIIPSDRLVKAALESKALSRFLRSAPSMHELGIFYHLKYFEESSNFDKLVIDMPATGHTLALSQLPERIAKIIKKGQIVDALRAGMEHITNPKYASMWITTLSETLPISEALEVKSALLKDGVQAAGVICNRSLKRDLSNTEQSLFDQILIKTLPEQLQKSSEETLHLLNYALQGLKVDQKILTQLQSFQRLYYLPELSQAIERAEYVSKQWLNFGQSHD